MGQRGYQEGKNKSVGYGMTTRFVLSIASQQFPHCFVVVHSSETKEMWDAM